MKGRFRLGFLACGSTALRSGLCPAGPLAAADS